MRFGGRGRRSLAAAVALVLAVAGALSVVPGTAGAGPVRAAAVPVDFGVIGVSAIEAWGGISLGAPEEPDGTLVVHLALGFASDRAALGRHALAVNDPGSPEYGRHASVAEEGARWNAPSADVAAVVAWFADRGATATPDPTRSAVTVDVPVATAAEALGVAYHQYPIVGYPPEVVVLTPADAPTALAPGLADRIDRVAGAVGLYDTSTSELADRGGPGGPRPPQLRRPTTAEALVPADGGTPWRTGTPADACPEAAALTGFGAPAGLSPGQLRTAYGVDALWSADRGGTGARIAVVDVGGYDPADLAAYRACFGLEGTPVTPHVVGTISAPVELETLIDLEVVSAVAPEAERIDWFVGYDQPGPLEFTRQMFEMMKNPLDASLTGGVQPDVVSVSFVYCEPELEAQDPGFAPMRSITDQMLATAAAAGIGYYAASGDDGANACWQYLPEPEKSGISVVWPASSPWVTAVGGTNLTLAPDNSIVSAGAWNDSVYGPPVADLCIGCGGGGGVSAVFDRGAYQRGPCVPVGTTRLVPDVSAMADLLPGYLLHYLGDWTQVGGTSAATPLTAGAFAVQAAIARREGRPVPGFVNPLLYDLAASGDGSGALLDVTLGDNDVYGFGGYPAGPGYDLATGLGSVLHDRLLAVLRERAVILRFTG